jgi:Asp-tRNA(Asn)/Glu-tRNA(Gln) amidotransferase A subunit family amidase
MPSVFDEDPAQNSIVSLIPRIKSGEIDHRALAAATLERVNGNASENSYVTFRSDEVRTRLNAFRENNAATASLFGIPVSVKDCFAVENYPTSVGSRFYHERNGTAVQDSALVQRLRQVGTLIIGKTHLHQLAYGITGENSDYGDCVQPNHFDRLTGGSSSGAAASVQEGSALFAIGTDTGGSIRVPASLCGLAGFRASLGIGPWEGGHHLAESFDTIGFIFRHLEDTPLLANALFGIQLPSSALQKYSIGFISSDFLYDCEPDVLSTFELWKKFLVKAGHRLGEFIARGWNEAPKIFAAIQAHEAAGHHRGHFNEFEPDIAERLAWGATITAKELADWRYQQNEFVRRLNLLFGNHDFLLLPCAPISVLRASEDNRPKRPAMLRYTTPASLAGLPCVVLPAEAGGCQLLAKHGDDGRLVALAGSLAALR